MRKENGVSVSKMKYSHMRYMHLDLMKIEARGWLKEQLRKMANGLTGHLEDVWDDVGPDSGWLGGPGESWERGPYYLDGLVPLAALLGDKDLKSRMEKWIAWTIDHQREDGYFGPVQNNDWWPRFIMLKVLIQYADITKNKAVADVVERFFLYLEEHIESRPFEMWAHARGCELFTALFWLMDQRKPEKWLPLAEKILKHAMDWNGYFEEFTYSSPTGTYMSWEHYKEKISEKTLDNSQPTFIDGSHFSELYEIYHRTHGVNIAMALKYPVYREKLYGSAQCPDFLKEGWRILRRYHGLANGLFSCDEHLNGRQPFQGTELCTVVESMFSLEEIIRITGDLSWGTILEEVALNMLPAAVSKDACSHQYNQQVNQSLCSVAHRNWYNNKDNSNIFGLEPHFGCCTANMHQGWPKFVSNSVLIDTKRRDGRSELLIVHYLPLSGSFCGQDGTISFRMETDYPFDGKVSLTFEGDPGERFDVRIRVPLWAKDYTLSIDSRDPDQCRVKHGNHSEGCLIEACRAGERIDIDWNMKPRLEAEQPSGFVVKRGPLLFALPIKGIWKEIEPRGRFSDFEVYPDSEWRYALSSLRSEEWEVVYNPGHSGGFKSRPYPVEIKLGAHRITNWEMKNNSAGPLPKHPVRADDVEEILSLVPYGCTDLRIAQFPVVLNESEK